MSKHTPGPWHTGHKGSDSVFTKCGHRICTVMPRYDDPNRSSNEDFANARLIAAAPELLSELRDFHDHTIDQGWHKCEGIPGGCPVAAAVAKAESKPAP